MRPHSGERDETEEELREEFAEMDCRKRFTSRDSQEQVARIGGTTGARQTARAAATHEVARGRGYLIAVRLGLWTGAELSVSTSANRPRFGAARALLLHRLSSTFPETFIQLSKKAICPCLVTNEAVQRANSRENHKVSAEVQGLHTASPPLPCSPFWNFEFSFRKQTAR